MIHLSIPGNADTLHLEFVVMDYNGTLAKDGDLLPGVREKLKELSALLELHIITADTFGRVQSELEGMPCKYIILPPDRQDLAKAEYVQALGPERTVCIGNGRNDCEMLKMAALGIGVIQEEGAALWALMAADVVCRSFTDAADLLLQPKRLIATLRR